MDQIESLKSAKKEILKLARQREIDAFRCRHLFASKAADSHQKEFERLCHVVNGIQSAIRTLYRHND